MSTERQQQILETAIALIDEKGIQGLTIKNLATEIGISEPGLYRHFSSKFEILHTILSNFHDLMVANREFISNSDLNDELKLKMIYQRVINLFIQTPALISVIFSEEIFSNDEKLTLLVRSIMEIKEQLVGEIFYELQKENIVTERINAEMFKLMYFGSLRLLVKKWKMNNYNFDLNKKGEELFNTIFNLVRQ